MTSIARKAQPDDYPEGPTDEAESGAVPPRRQTTTHLLQMLCRGASGRCCWRCAIAPLTAKLNVVARGAQLVTRGHPQECWVCAVRNTSVEHVRWLAVREPRNPGARFRVRPTSAEQ